jgi:hypothetical protein
VVTPTVQPVCWESYRTFHYLVPRGQSEAEYRRMYFYMYQHGCQFAEDWQQPHRGVTAEHSVHSFEDYVSNLMSFYANVMGWCTGRYTVTAQHDQREQTARQAIRSRAGGFADQAVRRQVSETVFAGIRDVQAGLRSSSWTRAYLRNDLVPAAHRPNTLQGWQDLPEAFRAFTPRQCYRFRHPRAEADQWALRRLGDFAEGVRRTAGRVGDAARDAVDWVRGRADDLSPGTRGGGGADTGVGDAGHRPGVEGQ